FRLAHEAVDAVLGGGVKHGSKHYKLFLVGSLSRRTTNAFSLSTRILSASASAASSVSSRPTSTRHWGGVRLASRFAHSRIEPPWSRVLFPHCACLKRLPPEQHRVRLRAARPAPALRRRPQPQGERRSP